MQKPSRIIAVDWSGDAKEHKQRKKIQLVKVVNGVPNPPESGWTREEVCAHLIEEAEKDPNLIVGLDFAFIFSILVSHRERYRKSSQAMGED